MLRRSLAFRLTILLATASTLVLLFVGHMVVDSLEAHFAEADLHELRGKMSLAQRALGKVENAADLAALRQNLDDALVGHDALEVTVLGPDRAIVFASHAARNPEGLLASLRDAAAPLPAGLVAWTEGDHAYRGIAEFVSTAISGYPPLVVVIDVRIDRHLGFVDAFARKLWIAVIAGILATVALAGLGVKMAMSPLRRVTDVARVVTANRLGERLNEDEVPAELADLAHAFNAMLERIEDSVRRLSEFSADLAHELRTPISNLVTQSQVALSKPRTADEYREVLYSNLEEYDRLTRMVSDMLFLAKADNGLIVPHCEAVSVAAEVRDLFAFYEALAEEQGVGLTLAGDAGVEGDHLMLRRALSNLLSNAIRHAPRGGRVSVQVSGQGRGSIRIAVSNSGVAIAAEHMARVFDRFYRVDPSRHRTHEGSGLGLSLTKSIIDAHGGRIVVESVAGETRFVIELAEAQARQPEATVAAHAGARATDAQGD